MSRPPSARPKTSSGRAATATRRQSMNTNAETHGPVPPSRAGVPRPASRASRMEMGAPVSGGTVIRPPSGFGAGTGQRPPTAMIQPRVSTGLARPPTSSARPLSQQGWAGGRAQSRMGTASTRQVFDKSYFTGILRAKMGQLTAEIGRLEDVFEKGEKDRMELVAYEKRAQESALEIKGLQGKLIDLNVIIDRMHTNSDMIHIEMEGKRVREAGDELEASVQELFSERQNKEREIEECAGAIEQQKRNNQQLKATMEPELRQRYEESKEMADSLRNEAHRMQEELSSLEEKRANLEMELEHSPLKKKAVQMYESLAILEAKEKELVREHEMEESPEEKKSKLIEEMRKNNEQIGVIEKQIEQTAEQMEQCAEELRDFDNDDSQFVKNNERYRELALKERQIEEFLKTFPEDKRMLAMEMEEYSSAVVQNLQKISVNLGKVSIESKITDMDPVGLGGLEKASAKELQDLHVRLQEEMISLEEMESRLAGERENLLKRRRELEEQMEGLGDLDGLSRNAEKDMQELESRREELQSTVPEKEEKQDELDERKRELEGRLDNDPNYAAHKGLAKKLSVLRETNEAMKRNIEERLRETDYTTIKQQVDEMRKQYNAYLLANSGRK